MKRILIVMMLLFGVLLHADEPTKGLDTLSSEVRGKFVHEMQYIEKEVQKLFSNMVKGNYEVISKTAMDIQSSYIIKRKLTEEQRVELKEKMSKEFIQLDKHFYESAGKLAVAAKFQDVYNMQNAFFDMTKTCLKCHSTYVTSRFPKLAEEVGVGD